MIVLKQQRGLIVNSIGDRIKQIRIAAGLSQVSMAQKIGVGQSTLAQMETGRRTVAERYIIFLASAFNVNPDWIKTGQGSMYKPVRTTANEQLSPTKKALIAAITALPENQCDALAAAAVATVEQLTYVKKSPE